MYIQYCLTKILLWFKIVVPIVWGVAKQGHRLNTCPALATKRLTPAHADGPHPALYMWLSMAVLCAYKLSFSLVVVLHNLKRWLGVFGCVGDQETNKKLIFPKKCMLKTQLKNLKGIFGEFENIYQLNPVFTLIPNIYVKGFALAKLNFRRAFSTYYSFND